MGLATILFIAETGHAALPEGRRLDIGAQGAGVSLSWLGITNAPYEVQARTNLTQGSWGPLNTIVGAGGVTVYPVAFTDSPSRFFRVLFPQPTLAAGEPAVVSGAGGTTLYISGQFFYAGDQIRVGGAILSNVTFLSSTMLSGTLPPQAPGLYDIEVISGQGEAVLATLHDAVQVSPPFYQTVQEPPEWPPAGPSPALSKEFKGHVSLLKAFDDEPPPPAAKTHTKSGHVSLLKAFEDETPSASARIVGLKQEVEVIEYADGDTLRGKGRTGHVTVLKAYDDTAPQLRLHSGEVQQQVPDLAVAGRGLDFAWVRTYRSLTGTDTAQGTRWSHSYDVRCERNGADLDVCDGTGRRDTFRLQPDGTYTCPGLFREGSFSEGAFRLTFADSGFWAFNPLDASPAAGKLARIQDRNGNAITCGYDGLGRLSHVVDTLGRSNTVAYTSEGRVASVTDCTGRTVTYAYYAGEAGGSAGDLKSVTSPAVTGTPNGNDFPAGKTITYTYSSGNLDDRLNHLLLTVRDALGQLAAQCAYDLDPASASFLRVLAIQNGTAPAACVTYLAQTPSPDNRFAALRCIVNDPAGNVTESFFDLRNRCVTQREYTGRAVAGLPVTDTVNRPTGKLRTTDPEQYVTLITWNNDSLCTSLTLPSGLKGTFVHAGDTAGLWRMRKRPEILFQTWDATATADGGADTDGDGTLDLTTITYQYTYDPRFGSDPGDANVRSRVNELESKLKGLGLLSRTSGDNTPIIRGSALGALASRTKYKGWDGTIKGVSFDGRDDDCDGFVTSSTDPRGNVSTAEYDAHGNKIRYNAANANVGIGLDTTSASFAYNAYGQCTSITNLPDAGGYRRVDTIQWSTHPVVVVRDAGGNACTTTFERDARGNVTRCVDPNGNDTLYTYNALDQLVACSSPPYGDGAGQRIGASVAYDANDNVVQIDTDNRRDTGASVVDNPVWTTRFGYDADNRCVSVAEEVDAATSVTNRFEYDANGRIAAHLSPAAVAGAEPLNRTAYAYDERGLLFQVAEAPGTPASLTTAYAYTGDGLVSKRDVDSALTVFDYDGFGRARLTTDALGNAAATCYDASGNLTVCRVLGETADLPGGANNRRLSETRWTYDGQDRCVERIDSFFDIFNELPLDDGARSTRFAYAPDGRCVAITNDAGHACSYTYDTAGRLASVTGPRGDTRICARDACGSITNIVARDVSDLGGPVQEFAVRYSYDGLVRRIGATVNGDNSVSWHYDSAGSLSRVTDPRGDETRYRCDGLGRCTDVVSYIGPCDADADGIDRGITISTSHVEYDVNGRVTAETDANTNTTLYAYDVRDRLVAVTNADGTAPRLEPAQQSHAGRGRQRHGH